MITEITITSQKYLVSSNKLEVIGNAIKEILIDSEIHYVNPRFDLEVDSSLNQKEIYETIKAHLETPGPLVPPM